MSKLSRHPSIILAAAAMSSMAFAVKGPDNFEWNKTTCPVGMAFLKKVRSDKSNGVSKNQAIRAAHRNAQHAGDAIVLPANVLDSVIEVAYFLPEEQDPWFKNVLQQIDK